MRRMVIAYLTGVGTIVLGAVVAKRWAATEAGIALVTAGAGFLGWIQRQPSFAGRPKKHLPPPEGSSPR